MAYTFGESPRGTNRRKRDNGNNNNNNAIFSNSNSSSSEHPEFNDGHSLTYSASSSQAGESTDSSVADIEFLKMIDKDQHIHLLEKASSQSFRRVNVNVNGTNANGTNGKGASFRRENSVADSSLGYSTDGDWPYEDVGHSVHGQQMFVSTKDGARRISSSSGQPSASQGHDGGNSKCIFAPANSTPKCNPKKGTNSNTSRFTPNQLKKRGALDFSSPTMVSTDISTPGSGTGSGSGYGSAASGYATSSTRSGTPTASTPSTPPPRHVKRMSAEDHDGVEVWYQKWWMCGFTDALNLNSS